MELLGLARQRSFRLSQSFCAVDPDTMKLFFFQRTLDRDRSFGKNGLDQGYFLDTHLVSAVYQLAWTTSIQTVKQFKMSASAQTGIYEVTLLSTITCKEHRLGLKRRAAAGV